MPIDFSSAENRHSYSGREADDSWRTAIRDLVDPAGATVVDIGCGGGTYLRAWSELGAARVVGVDSSAPLLQSAREDHGDLPGAEARRLLRPGGTYLVQDRTPDDVSVPGSPEHPRGWLFEVFHRLLDVERGRRHTTADLVSALQQGGFGDVGTTSLEEVRRRYATREDYLTEIGTRTGRSILHELDDAELAHLVDELWTRMPEGPLVERDRWTIWSARRP